MCAGKAVHDGMRTLFPQGEALGMLPDKDQKSPVKVSFPKVAEEPLSLLNIQIPWTLLSQFPSLWT